MLNKKNFTMMIATLSIYSGIVYADAPKISTVVAPQCLIAKMTLPYKQLASAQKFVLIETSKKGINELAKLKHARSVEPCGGFFNVTEDWQDDQKNKIHSEEQAKKFLQHYLPKSSRALSSTHYQIRYNKEVQQLYGTLNSQNILSTLTRFSAFEDRYSDGDRGVEAATWIQNKISEMVTDSNRKDVTITIIPTKNYLQPSVLVKMGSTLTTPGIVLGAHMDTLASDWFGGSKPGADDDGSGSMTLLEVARVMLNSDYQFNKPIYFVWYSAEEEGLIGSQNVVKYFKKKNMPVDAVMQMDMTGYNKNNKSTIWMMTDYTDTDLTGFVAELMSTYVKKPVDYSKCGYACSDHATWHSNEFKAVMPFETEMNKDNPDIHTSNDTIDKLDLEHMTDFAKLGIAFATELAEPKG